MFEDGDHRRSQKKSHPIVSLYRDIVIKECFSLEKYPLAISKETFVFILYYNGNYLECATWFFPFASKGFPCKSCASFFSSFVIVFSLSLTLRILGVRVLFPTSDVIGEKH